MTTRSERNLKRAFRIGAPLLLVIAAGFFLSALQAGAVGDRCAEALVRAATENDTAWIEAHVKSPSLVKALGASAKTELLFVRPASSEWTRVGVSVRSTVTATRAKPIFLLLSNAEGDACSFLVDYAE